MAHDLRVKATAINCAILSSGGAPLTLYCGFESEQHRKRLNPQRNTRFLR